MPRERAEKPHLVWRRGVWCISFYDGENRRRISTNEKDKQAAQRALADFEDQLINVRTVLTVEEALNRYAKDRKDRVVAFSRLKEAANALISGVGHLRVDQVNQARWDKYASNRMTRPRCNEDPEKHTPRPVSTSTLRREFNVLRAALRKAWKDGKMHEPPVIEPPAETAPRDKYLTKDEARKLLAACDTPHVKTFLCLAIFTGARKGSILSLTWDRVNFKTGMVDFQEPGRRLTAKRRAVVPMNEQLRAELKGAYERRESDYVVEYAGRAVPKGLRWSFRKLCQRAELTWTPTPHHLKHSVISWLAMERIPIDQAADLVATDPETLRRVYRKFDPAYLRDVADALKL